jgi:uncharacterized alpha-E superfamily protein
MGRGRYAVLSRIAESLFWIGRYVERAEDTARILDVHIHNLLESPMTEEAEICRSLTEIMGVVDHRVSPEHRTGVSLTARQVTELLAYDRSNPSSIVSSLSAARANARGVSEAISSEMWEALNITYNSLPRHVDMAQSVAPYAFFRFVRERAAIVAGLTESTMSRDDAWRFLVLGRSLERVDMAARLISTAVAEADVNPDWVVLLRSCSAHEAFLRTYRREPEPTLAAEFLLLDRLFPRSVFSALSDAEERLAELDPRSGRAGMPDEARRIVGHLRTYLEFRRIEDLMPDLTSLLGTIQRGCSAASAAVAARYFRETSPIEWNLEGVGLGVDAEQGSGT